MGKIFNSIGIETKNYVKAVGKEIVHGSADAVLCPLIAVTNVCRIFNDNNKTNSLRNVGYFAGMTLFSLARVAASPITAVGLKDQDYNENLPIFMTMAKQSSDFTKELEDTHYAGVTTSTQSYRITEENGVPQDALFYTGVRNFIDQDKVNEKYNEKKTWYVPYFNRI